MPGVKAETLVIGLDLAGVAVSSGSACSSGKVEASHVLSAMGVPEELAQGAIRVSLGFATKRDDIENFLKAFAELDQAAQAQGGGVRPPREDWSRAMPAVQETVARVKEIDVDKYKYGFTTDIELVRAPKGLNEETCPLHLGQEGRARLAARLAARGLSPLAHHAGADLGQRPLPQDRFPGALLLLGAEEHRGARRASPRSIPSCSRTYERLGIPLSEQKVLAGVEGARVEGRGSRSMPCSIPSRWSPPSRRSWPRPA